jgi:predicted dehydrogenase
VKALVAGFGSIGQRHARLLQPMVAQIAIVSSRPAAGYRRYESLETAITDFAPDVVVVATITSRHGESLNTLKRLGFARRVLIEKPIFAHKRESSAPYPFEIFVAYQLRFHPVVVALRRALRGQTIYTAHGYVGQHLGQWRPGRIVRETYSAHRNKGGGVVRDLSHELDLVNHLFGPIQEAQAIVARADDITVDSEDAAAFVLRTSLCPVISLQMNCLDHIPRREWIVTTKEASFKADLITQTVSQNNDVTYVACGPDDAYRAMHQALLAGDVTQLCTFGEGLALMKLIETVTP